MPTRCPQFRARNVLALVLLLVVVQPAAGFGLSSYSHDSNQHISASPVATPDSAPAQGDPFDAEKRLAVHLDRVAVLLAKLEEGLATGKALPTDLAALTQEHLALTDLDAVIRERLTEQGKKLSDSGLPQIIQERHKAAEEAYIRDSQTLLDDLSRIGAGSAPDNHGEILDAVIAARAHLEQRSRESQPPAPRENDLPFQPIHQEAPVLPISAATASGSGEAPTPAAPNSPPNDADLNPTIDVQITQEIIDLAASLDHSPLKIYEYVQAHFSFEPYLGSRKGSRETLLVASGNDYDLASLLIALLRASNIPARYVAGTVLVPIDQAMNWLGVTDPAVAGNLLATAGMEATLYSSGGQIVAVGFKHVWVIAYAPYGNYRGSGNDTSGKMWVPLDPSFKAYTYSPAVDIPAAMGFNADTFIDDYTSTFHALSPVELYLQQIQDWVAANRPDLTYPDDVFRQQTIVPGGLRLLPASTPYVVLNKAAEYAEIPAAKRHQIRFTISDDWGMTLLDYTANLPTIASQRVTISYVAATPADQATIDAYGDLYLTPPNLINLKPVLKIGGTTAAEGGALGAGVSHYSDMYFLQPAGESNQVPVIYNTITAGTYQGIGIDTYRVNMGMFMPAGNGAVPDTDGLTGEKLYRTAMAYLDRIDSADNTVAQTMQMAFTTAVSEAIVENVILVSYGYSGPVAWEWRGLIVDADRKIVGPFSIAGTAGEPRQFMVLTGADGSISENRIFEDTYAEEAISTIKILELSSDQGIPICEIATSIAADCPGFSQPSDVVNAVNSALSQGHVVTIPRTGITYHQWQGTGYIDMDPATGAAGYIIAGGQNGGATVDIWVAPWNLIFATLFRNVCGITANITEPAQSDYFPYPGFFVWPWNRQPPKFEVDYTVSYCGDGSNTVHETLRPHYQYGPGDYTFYAGWGTGATRDFTIFGVEVQTPDNIYAPKGGDPITLNANVTPRLPPGATIQWTKGTGGDGTFSSPNAQQTQFNGTIVGKLNVKVAVTNAHGTTDNDKDLMVFSVEILPNSDEYMARGYAGQPVAGSPSAASMKYRIEPGGVLGIGAFTPSEVKAKVSRAGADTRTATLSNASGDQTWDFDGKDDGNNYLDAAVYQVKLEVTAPGGKKLITSAHDLTVVEVTQVALQDNNGGALDNNAHPTQAGGLRAWVGKPTANGALVQSVRVVVTLSAAVPANKLKVYLKSYDVNDPTGLINANHPDVSTGTPEEGTLSDTDPPSDGDNNVQVSFTVTKKAGDNFKVFASTNEQLINNLTDAIVEANTNNAGDTTDARLQSLASPRLTVWRRFHIEMDSMGVVVGNSIVGNLTAVVNNQNGTSTVTTNQNLNEPPDAVNRFEDGLLRQGGNAFPVISNTDGADFQVVVTNIGAGGGTVPAVGAFTLVDDDDFNSNDGANPDGDAGDDVTNPPTSAVQDSDTGADNVFAFAYVRPVYDLGSDDSVAFTLNVAGETYADLRATFDFDNVATEADSDFWTAYLLGSYQFVVDSDHDPGHAGQGPDVESCTYGATDDRGSGIYRETSRECTTGLASYGEPQTVAHELGHLFGGDHTDPGLMCSFGNHDQGICIKSDRFGNVTLTRIRNSDHP